MTTTTSSDTEVFYEEGGLSETGRFLVWLADNGPTASKELTHFPGWGRAPKLPIVEWLAEHGYITRERTYNGKRGHPPIMHAVTTKGADWADILFPSLLGVDLDLTLITVKHRKHYGTDEHDGLYTALCNSTIEGPLLPVVDEERVMCANCRRRVHSLAREADGDRAKAKAVLDGPQTPDEVIAALTKRVEVLEATILEGQWKLVPVA